MEVKKPTYEELEQKVELLESQVELFDKLMEISPFYIFFKNSDIRTIKLSKNYEQMLGMKTDQLLGKTMDDLFPSDLAKSMIEDDKRVLFEGKIVEVVEEFKDQIMTTTKFPIVLKDGSVMLAGFTVDTTNKIKSERDLKEREAQLKELNETKDKFFSVIAHDLRSPFNSILGFTELLKVNLDQNNFTASRNYLKYLHTSAKSTLILLENLLDWAKSQTGQIEYKPERICLGCIINNIFEILNSTAEIKNISLHHAVPESIKVFADMNMLNTVFRNLISNAIKFSNLGGHVEVYALAGDERVEITVSDNGVGIQEEVFNNLFKIHAGITTLGTAQEKGSGLGLVLCKDFVEKQGGTIWAERKSGGGIDFKFTLPVYPIEPT
jgi:PAS domain S-box-containing protein